MDVATARWLVSDAAAPVFAVAEAEPDPESLGAATRVRALCEPDRAAAVLTQVALRRRARAKFGARADGLFFTPAGLEQATRASVAARRAARFRALGASGVVDLGCGVGADALALQDADLPVTAVEIDEVTALLASANLGAPVQVGDAEALGPEMLDAGGPSVGVFCDPARRTARGRTWKVEDFRPTWGFVLSLLDGRRPACVKLGPGVPLELIPEGVEAEWVSDAGDVVECALWAGPGTVPGRRRAVVDGVELVRDGRLSAGPDRWLSAGRGPESKPTTEDGRWLSAGRSPESKPLFLYEPDGAVIRAGLVPELARLIRAERVHDQVAYLAAPWHMPTPFASCFEVVESLPYDEKALRAWVRANDMGTLEIKKRGIDVDPAELRKRLKPKGRGSATLILTPTPDGAVVFVARRVR